MSQSGDMELSEDDLKGLIDRAGDLHGRIDDEIAATLSYCRFCSDQGRYCKVAGGKEYEDWERLIEIRDSLKDLETALVYLQRMRCWQLINYNTDVLHLEESRSNLIGKAKQYQGRALDPMQELNECFCSGEIVLKSRGKDSKAKEEAGHTARVGKRRVIGFLISCMGRMFSPWKWHEASGIGVRIAILFFSVSSTMALVSGSRRDFVLRRRGISIGGSGRGIEKGLMGLDVIHGRG